jgi:hypothetical protein
MGDATYTYVKAPSTRKSAAVTLVNDYLFCVNSSARIISSKSIKRSTNLFVVSLLKLEHAVRSS